MQIIKYATFKANSGHIYMQKEVRHLVHRYAMPKTQ